MAVILKRKNEDKFLESYNGVTGEVKLTDKMGNAKCYSNDWFAKAELEHLQFHFPEETKELVVYFT